MVCVCTHQDTAYSLAFQPNQQVQTRHTYICVLCVCIYIYIQIHTRTHAHQDVVNSGGFNLTSGCRDAIHKSVCAYIYIYTQTYIYTHARQDVVNSGGFNPTSGCRDAALCDGLGGLLAFLEVQAGTCGTVSTGSGGGASSSCDAGCIVGAVLGSVFGAALLGILAFVVWRK